MFKRSRAVAATLFVALAALPASAEIRIETENGGSLQFYGLLNPAYQSVDDGFSSKSTLVDNGSAPSRIGLWLRQDLTSGKLSFNFETALGLRPSFLVSQNFTPDGADWRRTSLRKFELIWQNDRFGTLSLGQGSMASDGAAHVDLSGTTLVGYNSIGDVAGGFRFRTTAGVLSGPIIGRALPSFDGGRRGRVRYDTPSFGGFSVSVAYGKEILLRNSDLKSGNIALRYKQQHGDFRVEGALAYARITPGTGVVQHDAIGSLSVLHKTGFSLTLAAGNRRDAGSYAYGKIGYQAKWLDIGKTAISFDYYSGDDTASSGSEAISYHLGIVQSLDKLATDVYLGVRRHQLSEVATSYADIDSVLFGMRWRF